MCIWASVTFSIPLEIFSLASQHCSSGRAIVTTVIFPPAACQWLLTTTLSWRISQPIQEVPWIKKQYGKTVDIAVQYLRRLTPEDKLFYVPSHSFPLFGALLENTFHCTHCTRGGEVQFQPPCEALWSLVKLWKHPCWSWWAWGSLLFLALVQLANGYLHMLFILVNPIEICVQWTLKTQHRDTIVSRFEGSCWADAHCSLLWLGWTQVNSQKRLGKL